MIYKFERKLKGANQVEATGEELTINNAGRKVQKFELSGRSKQKARSGYNLANLDADSFVKNGVTVTNNGDGSWTFNGTSSSSGDLILTKNILLNHKIYQFEDTKYLFKTIVVSGSFSNPDNVIVQTSAMGQDNGVDNFATLYNKLSDGVFVNIFNKKSTSHLSRFELYCGPNVTFNNYTIKILFAKTDNNELEWEQYGVSPSPDFPSEIKNVEDDVKIVIRNKNFCDFDILENIKGKGITINNRNSFTINLGNGGMGIATGTNVMLPNDIDKNKKYRIKYHRTMNNTTFLPYIKVLYADGSMDGVNDRNLDADYEYVTKGAEIASITLAWYTQSQGGIVTFSNISITEADEDNDFEESKKEEIIFPLAEGQKLYEGSYLAKDGIHNTRKQATLKPKVGQIGGATVNTETKNTSFLIYNNIFDNLKKGQPLRAPLCNKLQGTTSGNYKNFNNQIVQWWDTSADFCAAIQTDLVGTTNDSIASYINNNQFVLEYFLNEEEIIPYTPEQQEIYSQLQNLELFRGCNHITVESNVKPTIKLSYYDGELDMTDYKYNLQFKKHMQEM